MFEITTRCGDGSLPRRNTAIPELLLKWCMFDTNWAIICDIIIVSVIMYVNIYLNDIINYHNTMTWCYYYSSSCFPANKGAAEINYNIIYFSVPDSQIKTLEGPEKDLEQVQDHVSTFLPSQFLMSFQVSSPFFKHIMTQYPQSDLEASLELTKSGSLRSATRSATPTILLNVLTSTCL